MHIIIAVTGNTIGAQFIFKRTVAVAGVTGNLPMFPGQRIIGVPVMIEANALPAFLAMTVGTPRAVTSGMHIIETVTGMALGSRILILLVNMATVAGHLAMLTMQGVICLVMVEVLLAPALFAMAVIALLAKVFPVNVIRAVTGDTAVFGTAVFFPNCMTCHAIRSGMRTLQRIIRLFMIKRFPAELHDNRVATLVIIVAAAALFLACPGAAVKPLVFLHIVSHILVAIQAQHILASLAEWTVAAAAFALVLRMPLNELPGHHQRFDSGRIHLITICKHQHRHGHHQDQNQSLHSCRRRRYQYI